MGKESPKGFKEKDIRDIASIQAEYNNLNQQTPFGSLEFTGPNPAAGITPNTAITRLSPEQQALLEQQQVNQLMAGQTAQGRFGDLGAQRGNVEQAYFNRALGLLNPELDRREGALQQRLANQGLPQSSGAYNREYGRFETGVNQQLEQLANQAVLAGGAEESRMLQNILAMMGGGSPASPQFINTPQVTIPVNQPGGGGANPLTGALAGAAGLSALGPWGAGAGAGLGLLSGLRF